MSTLCIHTVNTHAVSEQKKKTGTSRAKLKTSAVQQAFSPTEQIPGIRQRGCSPNCFSEITRFLPHLGIAKLPLPQKLKLPACHCSQLALSKAPETHLKFRETNFVYLGSAKEIFEQKLFFMSGHQEQGKIMIHWNRVVSRKSSESSFCSCRPCEVTQIYIVLSLFTKTVVESVSVHLAGTTLHAMFSSGMQCRSTMVYIRVVCVTDWSNLAIAAFWHNLFRCAAQKRENQCVVNWDRCAQKGYIALL